MSNDQRNPMTESKHRAVVMTADGLYITEWSQSYSDLHEGKLYHGAHKMVFTDPSPFLGGLWEVPLDAPFEALSIIKRGRTAFTSEVGEWCDQQKADKVRRDGEAAIAANAKQRDDEENAKRIARRPEVGAW